MDEHLERHLPHIYRYIPFQKDDTGFTYGFSAKTQFQTNLYCYNRPCIPQINVLFCFCWEHKKYVMIIRHGRKADGVKKRENASRKENFQSVFVTKGPTEKANVQSFHSPTSDRSPQILPTCAPWSSLSSLKKRVFQAVCPRRNRFFRGTSPKKTGPHKKRSHLLPYWSS